MSCSKNASSTAGAVASVDRSAVTTSPCRASSTNVNTPSDHETRTSSTKGYGCPGNVKSRSWIEVRSTTRPSHRVWACSLRSAAAAAAGARCRDASSPTVAAQDLSDTRTVCPLYGPACSHSPPDSSPSSSRARRLRRPTHDNRTEVISREDVGAAKMVRWTRSSSLLPSCSRR